MERAIEAIQQSVGTNGNDTITINDGDILHGGTGSDVFVFKDTIDTATLADFETGIDTIRLSGAEFGWNITGELLEDMYQFGSELPDAFAQNEPVLFFNTTTNELSYDATGGTLDDSHVIATLSTGTLSISDFEIV